MVVKNRIIETNDGHQSEIEVVQYGKVAREMRDRGFLKENVDIVINYGIDHGLVLDVGSGPGYFGLEWLKRSGEAKLKTIEISSLMIEMANQIALEYQLERRIENILGDANQLPFEDESFQAVISNASLHEWENPGIVFLEICRVLKPGGKFCVIDLRRTINKATLGYMKDMVQGTENKKGFMDSVNASYTLSETIRLMPVMDSMKIFVEEYIFGVIIKGEKEYRLK